MEEPSVLDYLKSRLFFWRNKPIEIPEDLPEGKDVSGAGEMAVPTGDTPKIIGAAGLFTGLWSLLPLGIVLVALVAQTSLEPPQRNPALGGILYGAAALLLLWQGFAGRWRLPHGDEPAPESSAGGAFRRASGIAALVLLPVSFVLFHGNRFTGINLTTWAVLVVFFLAASWETPAGAFKKLRSAAGAFLKRPQISIRLTPWAMLVLLCGALVLFLRLNDLQGVPGEMFSDHAEKLLDVSGVLDGQTLIFFPRNTGREAVQMYLTAAVGLMAGTGLSFMSLKLGTVLAGLLALPFIYLIGKQVGGRWVGLFALLLCGAAYWPNVISRIGLRFPLYPLFTAPAVYFLIRGFQQRSRNSLILAGLMVGLGMHGYSPFRIVPLLILIAFILYFAFGHSNEERSKLGLNLLVLALAALIMFLPLLKYLTEDPTNFGARAFSRLGTVERPLPGHPLEIFISNSWKALAMFFWDNGNIWVHSVVGRPALDIVTAVFFFIGCLVSAVRFVRERNWLDLFMLVSVPVLLLPSILSLAFPDENPSLNRTAGAIVPVFVLAAFGFVSFLQTLAERIGGRRGTATAAAAAVCLAGMSILQNYDLVFRQFERQFMASALNTSEIGAVIRAFDEVGGSPDTAYVVPYPYWVDTRLVGINAGYPNRDFALAPDQISSTLEDPGMKLFILKPDDEASLKTIRELYPRGILSTYRAKVQGRDFLTYLIPPD